VCFFEIRINLYFESAYLLILKRGRVWVRAVRLLDAVGPPWKRKSAGSGHENLGTTAGGSMKTTPN
jgi:hypothetical protein